MPIPLDEPPFTARTPFITKLRHALIGRGSSVGSAVNNAAGVGMLGHAPDPGPFDSPPPEPIDFDGPLPWELREGGD